MTDPAPSSTVRSFCRICAAHCGIVVDTAGDRVLRVGGDPTHPVSRGYVCGKGRGLPDWHHRDDRLDEPRLCGEPVSWSVVLDDLADALHRIADDAGPDAVALYLATGLAYDAAGQIAALGWLRSTGSSSFFTAATVDNAPAMVVAESITGDPMASPVWDHRAGGLLVMIGTNPVVSHGYGTALPDPIGRLRDHRAAGGMTWVIDPRRTETAAHADRHLAIRPGTDVALLAAVAAELLAGAGPVEGCDASDLDAIRRTLVSWTIDRAAAVGGIDAGDVRALVADLRRAHGRVAILCGTGAQMSGAGVLVEWLRWLLLIITESIDRDGGMRFHDGVFGPPRVGRNPRRARPGPASRPELGTMAGQIPLVALADEIEAGNIRALLVTGGNPITAAPDPDRTRAALEALDVLAVVDVAENDVSAIATHVLPATGQLERADFTMHSYALDAVVQATSAVVAPVASRRPVWWMFGELEERANGDTGPRIHEDDIDDEAHVRSLLGVAALDAESLFEAGSHGVALPVRTRWVLDRLPDRRWAIAPPELLERMATWAPPPAGELVMVPRRDGTWNNSVRYGAGEPPTIHLHADDAAAAGIADGDTIEVASAAGSLQGVARLDATLRRGVMSVGHGRSDRSPGRLASAVADIEPRSWMPRTSAVPVRVRRVPPDSSRVVVDAAGP